MWLYLFLTPFIDGGGWPKPRPGRFNPRPLHTRKQLRYPLYRRLGRPRAGLDGCGKEKISCLIW